MNHRVCSSFASLASTLAVTFAICWLAVPSTSHAQSVDPGTQIAQDRVRAALRAQSYSGVLLQTEILTREEFIRCERQSGQTSSQQATANWDAAVTADRAFNRLAPNLTSDQKDRNNRIVAQIVGGWLRSLY
jgi:hypothetical protein